VQALHPIVEFGPAVIVSVSTLTAKSQNDRGE